MKPRSIPRWFVLIFVDARNCLRDAINSETTEKGRKRRGIEARHFGDGETVNVAVLSFPEAIASHDRVASSFADVSLRFAVAKRQADN